MTRPSHVVVIGAGFAGLSCAVALAARGTRVTVLEARRTPGGRAGSFADPSTGEVVDNGQHIFLACYRATRSFLETIGTGHLVRFQKNLVIDYLEPGARTRLSCPPLPAPWHMLAGMLALGGLSWGDRLALLKAGPALRRIRAPEDAARLEGTTVTAWLDRLGQTPELRRRLWHPLAIATLNESPDSAPASLLARVLLEGFLTSRSGSALGIATVGLGDLYIGAATRYLERRGGEVVTGSPVTELACRDGRVVSAATRDGGRVEADAFVSAVGPRDLARLGVPLEGLDRFGASPIFSVNLWLDRPASDVADFDFAGMLGCRTEWLFNKQRIFGGRAKHLSAVMSAARDLAGRSNDELAGMAWEDIRRCLPAARSARLDRWVVVRERTATFSATLASEPLRPGPASPWENLVLAGDWTVRGLPATIEAAVRSGYQCAERLCA